MNDDMLSQDEINELLKGFQNNDESNDGEGDNLEKSESASVRDDKGSLTLLEKDTLGEIGNITFGSAATALSTLVNKKVEIATPEVSVVSKDELQRKFPQPNVAVRVDYCEGLEGLNLMVFSTTDAATIADLMIGGDGTNHVIPLGEMEISALQESMNQMMGSASSSMSTIFDRKVNISPPRVDVIDISKGEGIDHFTNENYIVKVSFQFKVGEVIDSSIMQIISLPFAKYLVEELTSQTQESASNQTSNPDKNDHSYSGGDELTDQETSYREEASGSRSLEQSKQHLMPEERQNYNREQQHLGASSSPNHRNADIQPAAFSNFEETKLSEPESNNLEMLLDIPLEITVELGRTKRSIKEILEFGQGSIIELDKLAGEPVDILVNQKLIAKGEVVVIDENFGVRVTDIVSQADRIRKLR